MRAGEMTSVRRSAKTVNKMPRQYTREDRLLGWALLLLLPAAVTVPACVICALAGDRASMGILGTLTALLGIGAVVLVIRSQLTPRR